MADVNIQIKKRNGAIWDNLFPRTKAELVIESTSKQFVTSAQKSEWSGKQNALGFTPENSANKNKADGYVGLGANLKIPEQFLPDITITDTFVVASQTEMLALTAQVGDIAIRTDLSKTFILKTTGSSVLANWQELASPLAPVSSVNGKTDVGLNNVTNEAKATMFTNPTFTGVVTMPTPVTTDNSTKGATTAYVKAVTDGMGKTTVSATEPTTPNANDFWYEIV